jgi:hypothetical protein
MLIAFEALAFVTSAVSAGIFNDLGSGSNVDARVITASHTDMLRNFVKPNPHGPQVLLRRCRPRGRRLQHQDPPLQHAP